MSNWEKLYSNLWIRISDDNFGKLLQIQKDFELKSVEEVLELLVNSNSINRLAKESDDYAAEKNMRLRSRAS
jgi:hypothetical protein